MECQARETHYAEFPDALGRENTEEAHALDLAGAS